MLLHRLQERIKIHRDVEVVLAPSHLLLQPLSMQIDRRKFRLAAQNAYHVDEGAFTGEVSFTMLKDLVHYTIIGHSERRLHFHEDLEIVRDKVAAATRNNITPIVCVGETNHERLEGETKQVLHDQIVSALANLTKDEVADTVIAYEPVWAISTFGGQTAKPEDIKQAIEHIRSQIADLYSRGVANQVRVLYGGSVDDTTAGSYLAIDGCDGVLVGSASLHYDKFAGIVDVAYKQLHDEDDKVG